MISVGATVRVLNAAGAQGWEGRVVRIDRGRSLRSYKVRFELHPRLDPNVVCGWFAVHELEAVAAAGGGHVSPR